MLERTATAQTLLHLSLIPGNHHNSINKIIASSESKRFAIADIYSFNATDFAQYCGIATARANKLMEGLSDTALLDKELAYLNTYTDISWCTIADTQYPSLLKTIAVPPPVIYWQGAALQEDEKRLAVVGARKANEYGKQFIDCIIPTIVSQQWVIVSGGAIGADTFAHQATLAVNGKTVAILGSGLLNPYPTENISLFKKIVASGGTLLSTFPLATQAAPAHFPERNRIISGISKGCVVVQAAKRSGASITAHCALEQGREVFAVPGPIYDPLSAGCHALIQEGAKLVSNAAEILQEFGELVPVAPRQERQMTLPIIPLAPDQAALLNSCPASINDLLESTGLSLQELNAQLFELQLAGLIEQDFTGRWQQVK
ncbi:MAG TPA: DNA-processing protein DprA [Candidatus Babeliales bacterium]|nr:DNA-processing protein DprA [Candidatus Babeliales bacterium]